MKNLSVWRLGGVYTLSLLIGFSFEMHCDPITLDYINMFLYEQSPQEYILCWIMLGIILFQHQHLILWPFFSSLILLPFFQALYSSFFYQFYAKKIISYWTSVFTQKGKLRLKTTWKWIKRVDLWLVTVLHQVLRFHYLILLFCLHPRDTLAI